MKAFRFEKPRAGLSLRHIPIPKPGPNQVLIQVKAAGLCHSDCHLLKGDGSLTTPITLGHEVSGIVASAGSEVRGFQPGDRVAIGLRSHPFESQEWTSAPGLGCDGGYAEYALASAAHLERIPQNVSFAQAAVATDAMATAYHAVVIEAGVRPGMTVCIIGIGGLGMSGLVFAVLLGANVYAVDVVPMKLKEAVRLGAHECFENLDEARGVDFDVIIDFAGTGQTTSMAVEKTRKGGKVVVVGLAASSITVSVTALVTRSISIIGSFGASQDDLRAVFKLLADGKVPLELCEIDFADVPGGLDALNKGCISGRLWTDPSKSRRNEMAKV
ncbi:alcohol dehydrogenase [Colletotrichum siamense]|nr:alcohol dehydrogenase [Colletotrichum siamense]